MADCRAKPTKIWDSGYYSAQMKDTFDARLLDFGLGSFCALCKISYFTVFKTLLLSQFSSDFIQTWYKVYSSLGNTGYYFLGDLLKSKNKLWYFKIFLNTGPYPAGISAGSAFYQTIFVGAHPNFMRTLVTMVDLNAC